MNKILYFFISIVVFALVLDSKTLNVELKKDQELVLHLRLNSPNKLNSNKSENIHKPLKLRWTLYKNEGVVMHLKYDHFPHQFILYKEYGLDQYTLNLSDTQGVARVQNGAKLKIFFKNINNPYIDTKAMASFKIYLEGNAALVE